jgi:hypothetical protein
MKVPDGSSTGGTSGDASPAGGSGGASGSGGAVGGSGGASGSGGGGSGGGGAGGSGGAGGVGGSGGTSLDAGGPDGARDGAAPDVGGGGDVLVPTDTGPDALGPGATLLVPGRARLMGTHQTACSNGPGTGDRWCALTLPSPMIGRTDLWAINLTKALAGPVPKCDGTDANCKRISDNLWTGQPMNGPSHPFTHRFDGDTLVFHANASVALDPYAGAIYAWRPEWAAPKQISGGRGYSCSAHATADAYVCIENLTSDPTLPLQFDLTAGKLSTAMPATLQKITPTRPNTQSSQWRVAFTRAGDYITWSTGGTTVTERETIYIARMDDLATRTMIAPGVSRWNISADSTKIYYLRDYNYSTVGDPQGTLMMADFPSGANETMLLTQKVGAFQVLAEGAVDKGIGFFDTVLAGKATYKIMADRANPAGVVTVVNNMAGVLALSRDLKYLYYFRDVEPNDGTTDGYIAKTDGSNAATGGCTLTAALTSDQFGPPFAPIGGLVMWVENVDVIDGVAEGWLANPEGCTNKRKWSDRADFWFFVGAAGLLYSDEGAAESSNLKHASLAGSTVGAPTLVQRQIGRVFGLPVGLPAVLYTLIGTPPIDGLYFSRLPFPP